MFVVGVVLCWLEAEEELLCWLCMIRRESSPVLSVAFQKCSDPRDATNLRLFSQQPSIILVIILQENRLRGGGVWDAER